MSCLFGCIIVPRKVMISCGLFSTYHYLIQNVDWYRWHIQDCTRLKRDICLSTNTFWGHSLFSSLNKLWRVGGAASHQLYPVFWIRFILIWIRILGPVSFWYGSGSSDPFREITDPISTLNRENANSLFTFFLVKNIFLLRMICFVIYEVKIYVR